MNLYQWFKSCLRYSFQVDFSFRLFRVWFYAVLLHHTLTCLLYVTPQIPAIIYILYVQESSHGLAKVREFEHLIHHIWVILCLVINSLQDSLVAINRKNDIFPDNLSDPWDKFCTPDLRLQGFRMICVGRGLWMSLLLQMGHLLCPLCSWRQPRTEITCGFIFFMTCGFQQTAFNG